MEKLIDDPYNFVEHYANLKDKYDAYFAASYISTFYDYQDPIMYGTTDLNREQNMSMEKSIPYVLEDFYSMDLSAFYQEYDKFCKTGVSPLFFRSNIVNIARMFRCYKTRCADALFTHVSKVHHEAINAVREYDLDHVYAAFLRHKDALRPVLVKAYLSCRYEDVTQLYLAIVDFFYEAFRKNFRSEFYVVTTFIDDLKALLRPPYKKYVYFSCLLVAGWRISRTYGTLFVDTHIGIRPARDGRFHILNPWAVIYHDFALHKSINRPDLLTDRHITDIRDLFLEIDQLPSPVAQIGFEFIHYFQNEELGINECPTPLNFSLLTEPQELSHFYKKYRNDKAAAQALFTFFEFLSDRTNIDLGLQMIILYVSQFYENIRDIEGLLGTFYEEVISSKAKAKAKAKSNAKAKAQAKAKAEAWAYIDHVISHTFSGAPQYGKHIGDIGLDMTEFSTFVYNLISRRERLVNYVQVRVGEGLSKEQRRKRYFELVRQGRTDKEARATVRLETLEARDYNFWQAPKNIDKEVLESRLKIISRARRYLKETEAPRHSELERLIESVEKDYGPEHLASLIRAFKDNYKTYDISRDLALLNEAHATYQSAYADLERRLEELRRNHEQNMQDIARYKREYQTTLQSPGLPEKLIIFNRAMVESQQRMEKQAPQEYLLQQQQLQQQQQALVSKLEIISDLIDALKIPALPPEIMGHIASFADAKTVHAMIKGRVSRVQDILPPERMSYTDIKTHANELPKPNKYDTYLRKVASTLWVYLKDRDTQTGTGQGLVTSLSDNMYAAIAYYLLTDGKGLPDIKSLTLQQDDLDDHESQSIRRGDRHVSVKLVFSRINVEFMTAGKRHRTDGPAVISYASDDDINIYYYNDGELHRDVGPAERIITNGVLTTEAYWVHGKRHRIDGPALISYRDDGKLKREGYWIDDERSRPDGPAIIEYDDGEIISEEYLIKGKRHRPRQDGPAKIIYRNGEIVREEYWEHGGRVS